MVYYIEIKGNVEEEVEKHPMTTFSYFVWDRNITVIKAYYNGADKINNYNRKILLNSIKEIYSDFGEVLKTDLI